MGKLSYYIWFIPNTAQIAAPLHHLRRKGVRFVWSAECESAFQQLKDALLSDRVLVYFDPQKPVIILTTLLLMESGQFSLIRLTMQNVLLFLLVRCSTQHSKITVIWRKKLWPLFMGFVSATSISMAASSTWCRSQTSNIVVQSLQSLPHRTAQKLQSWALLLSNYQYEIVYRPTTKHPNADTLLRLPVGPEKDFDNPEESCFHIN